MVAFAAGQGTARLAVVQPRSMVLGAVHALPVGTLVSVIVPHTDALPAMRDMLFFNMGRGPAHRTNNLARVMNSAKLPTARALGKMGHPLPFAWNCLRPKEPIAPGEDRFEHDAVGSVPKGYHEDGSGDRRRVNILAPDHRRPLGRVGMVQASEVDIGRELGFDVLHSIEFSGIGVTMRNVAEEDTGQGSPTLQIQLVGLDPMG